MAAKRMRPTVALRERPKSFFPSPRLSCWCDGSVCVIAGCSFGPGHYSQQIEKNSGRLSRGSFTKDVAHESERRRTKWIQELPALEPHMKPKRGDFKCLCLLVSKWIHQCTHYICMSKSDPATNLFSVVCGAKNGYVTPANDILQI